MKKRLLASLLVGILSLSIVSGCGKEKVPNGTTAEPGNNQSTQINAPQSKYAYKPNYIALPASEDYSINYISNFCTIGDKVFFAAECVVGQEPQLDESGNPIINEATGEPYYYDEMKTKLFQVDMTRGAFSELENYVPLTVPDGMEGSVYISSMFAGTDDTFWLYQEMNCYYYDLPENFNPETQNKWEFYMDGGSSSQLTQHSADGSLLKSVELSTGDENGSGVYNLVMDEQGYIYANSNSDAKIYVFDQDGKVIGALDNEEWGNVVKLSENQVGVVNNNQDGKRVFRTIDPVALSYGTEMELCYQAYDIRPGNGDYEYLYNNNGTIYGFNKETQESERMFSWMDCDINSDTIGQFSILSDGRVIGFENDWSQEERKISLVVLEQVDASTLPQKQELVLACMYLDWNMRTEIIKFNKSHDDVRIVVNDYSQYATEDNYNAGVQKLNTEILSGMAPDILCTDSLPIDQYAARGVLMDLWPLIDNDSELGRDGVMEHFFDVLSVDGKLYQLYQSFSISTVVGSKAVVGDKTSWTVADVLAAKENLQEGATIFGQYDTRDSMLTTCISQNMDTYIDWTTGQCSFDSQDFIDLLKFSSTFPEEINWEDFDDMEYESDYIRLKNGKQLLLQANLSSFRDYTYYKTLLDGDASFIGYPSANGNGSCFSSFGGMAISASCVNTDAAWSFVRYFMTEEYQKYNGNVWAFPTNRKAFELRKEEAMKPAEENAEGDLGINVATEEIWIDENTSIPMEPLTQADYEKFMELYESCHTLSTYNQEILDIIKEETAAFFDGQKTAEETARLIQNRVSLFVAEQG